MFLTLERLQFPKGSLAVKYSNISSILYVDIGNDENKIEISLQKWSYLGACISPSKTNTKEVTADHQQPPCRK